MKLGRNCTLACCLELALAARQIYVAASQYNQVLLQFLSHLISNIKRYLLKEWFTVKWTSIFTLEIGSWYVIEVSGYILTVRTLRIL